MATLKEVRSAFPEYAEVPDDVLSEALYKKFGEGQDKADFLLELKGRGPRIGPVKASYEGLKSSSQTGIARLLYAAGAEETAKEMQQRSEERQQDVAERYQPAVSSYKDVTGPLSAGQYLYEGIAQSIPSMGAMAAGAAAGAAAGSVIPGLGTLAGGTIGAGLALFPSYIGGNIQAQMEEGKKFEETSLPAAATAAAGQTAADVVAGKLLLRAFPGLGAPGGTSRLLNSARRGVEGMAAEAPTEAIQDALEIMQANPNKFFEFGPEVQDRIINAAILGGGAGFLIGGTGGALSRPAPKVAPPKGEAGTAEQPPANLATKIGVEPPPEQAATEPVETEPTGAAAEPGATTEPVAAEPPIETAPAPRIEPAAAVEPGTTVEPTTTTEPGVTTTPVTTEPAAAPTAQGPAPIAAEPAPAPEPAPVEPVEPVNLQNIPPLPKKLAAGAPKYDKFRLQFPSGVERALFQISKANPTQQDLEYRDWLKGQGLTDTQITEYGKQLRVQLKQQFQGMKNEPASTPMVVQPFTPIVKPEPVKAAPLPTAKPVPTTTAQPTAVAEPTPATAQATPTKPPTTAQPAPPPPQTAPFTQAPSEFVIDTPFENELEQYIPGIGAVMREIQQNLFPGTKMSIVRTGPRANFRGQMQVDFGGLTANDMTMRLNIDALKSEFTNPEKFKAKLLHTIFHEMSHPVEYFYVANASKEEITAVLQQYVKDRNPDSMQRSLLVKDLSDLHQGKDLAGIVDTMLKATGLTRQQYDKFLQSQTKIIRDAGIRRQEFGAKYQRGFSEWVAEKGAKFFTKNLDQLVPKTVFEKFQKNILEVLRDLYSRIAKYLGMPDTEGAFEQLLKDRYGKVRKTPAASIMNIQKLREQPAYIRSKEAGVKAQTEGATVTAEEAAPAEAPADVASATQKLANVYTKPESMGFKGFLRQLKEAYDSGSYKTIGDKITRAITDRFIDLRRLDERFAAHMKSLGLNLPAAYDNRYAIAANQSAYAGILARENVLGMLESILKYGGVPVIKKMTDSKLDGVLTVSREQPGTGLNFLGDLVKANKLDDFKYYAMAKRVLGRYADKQAPITQDEAKAIVEHYGKDPEVVKAYNSYQDFNKAMMQMAVDAGVISQDIANEFMKHNDYYPFYREMDETGRYTGPLFTSGVLTRTKIQQAIGGTEKLEADPIEVIMKNAQFWMHSAAKNLASQKIFTMMEGLGEARPIKKGAQLRPGEIQGVTRVNGTEQYYAISNPDIASALETTGAHQLPNWTGIPGKFTQFYRELVTRSPDFILKNIIRDPLGAFVTSGVSFNPFAAMNNFRKALTSPQSSPELRALQDYGIIGGFRSIPGTEDATQLLNTNFKPTSNGIYVVPNGNVLTGILSKAWNALGAASEASDAATRMEIFKKVYEATGNEAEAAFRAQEVINFRKQGASSIVRYLSIMVPFINGRLQGLDVTARAFGPQAFKNTMIKGGYLFAVSMALQALMGDDEEYKQLPDYVRYASLPVPLRLLGLGETGFLAIPKPFEIGFVFQTFPEVLVQAAMGNTEDRAVQKVAWEQLKNTFGLALFPQIIAPVAELLTNRSSLTGLPIVTEAQKNLPAELQYTATTSDVVKNLAGSMGLSPVQVESLIKGYGGQIVTSMLGLIDGMYRSATGTGVDKDWTQYPTISTFLKTAQNTNPKGVADIYRLSAEIQGLTTAINTYVAQGMGEKAIELMKENEGLLSMKQSISGLRTQLNTLSRNERMIVNNPNIPQDQKEAQVEQIREARRQLGKLMTQNISLTGK